MSLEHVRMAFERWHNAANEGLDLLSAFHSVCAPDCINHMQNGDDGTTADAESYRVQGRSLYPDLSLEIDHVTMTDDRMILQMTVSGTPSLIFRIARGRRIFSASAAVIGRVNERAEVVEVWPYLNPGAMLTFPPQSHPAPPPIPDGLPGTAADARAVLAQWQRATTGPEFLERILASASQNCLVHATNTDAGGVALVESQFHVVLSAFPDLTVQFRDGFVTNDLLVAQFIFDGTQRGWLGIAPPRGSRAQSTGAIIARVGLDQTVQEMWVYLAPGMGLFFPRKSR